MKTTDYDASNDDQVLTIHELAYVVGTSKRVIERMITFDLVKPLDDRQDIRFPNEEARRVRKLIEIHSQLGVGWSSMGLVVELLERIEQLESRLPDDG